MTPFVQGLLFLAIAGFMLWLAFADPDSVIDPRHRDHRTLRRVAPAARHTTEPIPHPQRRSFAACTPPFAAPRLTCYRPRRRPAISATCPSARAARRTARCPPQPARYSPVGFAARMNHRLRRHLGSLTRRPERTFG